MKSVADILERVARAAWRSGWALALVGGILSPLATVHAVEVKVTGEFRPSTLSPNETTFRNTTPPDLYCRWRPATCAARGIYMFRLGGGTLWTKRGSAGPDARRDTTYLRAPMPRIVTLREARTGAQFDVNISFVAMSMHMKFGRGADPWYHGISGGCAPVQGAGGRGWSLGGWAVRNPSSPVACYSSVRRNNRTYRYTSVGVGIEITLPPAVELRNGQYTAQETWTVGGEEADIDLGDNISGDPAITMNFVFDVEHDFQIMFPAAAPVARLLPKGGWQQWTEYRKLPARLEQLIPFQLTSSGEFSVKLRCEHPIGSQCGIRSAATHTVVPLEVTTSLPSMHRKGNREPAVRVPLVAEHSGSTAPRFSPRYYSPGHHSSLELAVVGEGVRQMLDEGAGTWDGNITVIYDANP